MQLVIGTAGHIDHGKSSLVRALTGTDPDRLPEEKARGMTIDLGFAHTRVGECDLYFVDVPGHERFIRNMVAGATGIDLALLVVAADDAVMPQTREHAELLMLLGITRCIIVLTKMDLVDEEWATAVDEDVRRLLGAVRMESIATVRTSVQSGRGLEELRALLQRAATARGASPAAARASWFRLPIDRVFSIAGRGTVVTGSVWHGAVAQDDELELLPAGRRVRVRDLQAHNDPRAAATGRMRLAINLAGIAREEVQRGCELATPGILAPTRCIDAWLPLIRMPGRARRTAVRARLHIATREVLAEVRLLPADVSADSSTSVSAGASSVAAGGAGASAGAQTEVREVFAQIKVAEPIVCTWGQRFVIRDETGARTLGGGQVLNPLARPWTARFPPRADALSALRDGAPLLRVEEICRQGEWEHIDDAALVSRAGLTAADEAARLRAALIAGAKLIAISGIGVHATIHASHVDDLATALAARLEHASKDNPRWAGVPRGEWAGWMPRACPSKLRPALAELLIATQRVSVVNGFVLPREKRSDLSAADQQLLEAILAEFAAGAFQPPAPTALRCANPRNQKRVGELIGLATARGLLVRVADDFWLHADQWRAAAGTLADRIRAGGPITVAEIRTLLNSSRKYVVPLCEAFDAAGVTKRAGDTRTLGAKAPPPAGRPSQ